MRIITKRALTESWIKYPSARASLAVWEERIKHNDFKNHVELKHIFADADYIPNEHFRHLTVFNIKKNEFRLVVEIFFNSGLVFIKWFGTHASYDRMDLKTFKNGGFNLC